MIITQIGIDFELLPNGRLADIHLWTPEIAQAIASHEELTLTEEHWDIIYLMRDFYSRYNISPVVRLLKKNIRLRFGDAYTSNEYLDSLFPHNVLIQGTRIAGLPVPMLDAEMDTPRLAPVEKIEPCIKPDKTTSYFINEFAFEGQSIKVYPSGNLVDPSEWNEAMAKSLANQEGIHLIDEHWEIIRYLRHYYFKYGITPMVKLLVDNFKEASNNRMVNIDHLYTLFPDGPARQGSRIAGLPSPQGCID